MEVAGVVIPSNPEDRKKIKDALEEIATAMIRMGAERSLIGDIKKQLKEDYELPPKIINKMAKVYFSNNYEEVVAEDEAFQEAFELIVGPK